MKICSRTWGATKAAVALASAVLVPACAPESGDVDGQLGAAAQATTYAVSVGIHRMHNPTSHRHFYEPYVVAGTTVEAYNYFHVLGFQAPGTAPMLVCHNPSTGAKDLNLNACGAGWATAEVLGYVATGPLPGTVPLYRLYRTQTGDFFHTTSYNEAMIAAANGYTYWGVNGYVYANSQGYAAEGYLDRVNADGTIDGWAYDPDAPTASIDVHLYVDGVFASAIHTNLLRNDVNAARNTTGNHGFHVTLPPSYFDGAVHSIELYALDTSGFGPNPTLGIGTPGVQKRFQVVPAVTPAWRYAGTEVPISSGWEEYNPAVVNAPGFRSHFWGRPNPASGCGTTMNGPTTTASRNPASDMGVTSDASTHTYTPTCNGQKGEDYVAVRPGALGLFTQSGPTNTFFRGYGPSGNQAGVNSYNTGNFLTFRQEVYTSLASKIRPWNGAKGTAVFTSAQTVKQVSGGTGAKLGHTQQAVEATFLHQAAFDRINATPANARAGMLFSFQAIYLTAVVRSDGHYPTTPTIYADAAQGGLAAVYGEVGPSTQYWASLNPTLHSIGAAKFDISMTTPQLQSLVRAITAKMIGHAASDADVFAAWGPSAFDRSQWTVVQTSVQQEVENEAQEDPGSTSVVYIGGNATSLEIRAL